MDSSPQELEAIILTLIPLLLVEVSPWDPARAVMAVPVDVMLSPFIKLSLLVWGDVNKVVPRHSGRCVELHVKLKFLNPWLFLYLILEVIRKA
jgi:hypothetical protein